MRVLGKRLASEAQPGPGQRIERRLLSEAVFESCLWWSLGGKKTNSIVQIKVRMKSLDVE